MDRRMGLTRFFVPDASFIISAFFGVLSWWYNRRLLESLGVFDAAEYPGMHQAISDYAAYSIAITAIAFVGTVLFVTLLSLFLLHRISGPVYRLKQHMLGIMMGRPAGELKFRKDDQLSDLSATFNEFTHHLGLVEERPRPASPSDATEEESEELGVRAEA
jgi:nitrogen fixation/metabolism regulation signal transduction histidine kinase